MQPLKTEGLGVVQSSRDSPSAENLCPFPLLGKIIYIQFTAKQHMKWKVGDSLANLNHKAPVSLSLAREFPNLRTR